MSNRGLTEVTVWVNNEYKYTQVASTIISAAKQNIKMGKTYKSDMKRGVQQQHPEILKGTLIFNQALD